MQPEDLFLANQALVPYTLMHIMHMRRNEDLLQEGYIGLWKACLTFDETKGYKFSTYATHCIYNALARALEKINKNKQIQTISLQEDISPDTIDPLTLEDVLMDPNSTPDVINLIIVIKDLKDNLTGTRKKILERRMEGKTMTEITKELNISKQRVTQVLQDLRRKHVHI